MRPVKHVAIASINVVIPNVEWIGTKNDLNAAVAPSQQSKIKKLKNPTTNCKKEKKKIYVPKVKNYKVREMTS